METTYVLVSVAVLIPFKPYPHYLHVFNLFLILTALLTLCKPYNEGSTKKWPK